MITISRDDLTYISEQEHRDFILINVLSNDAFNKQHIRSSIYIPFDQPQFVQLVGVIARNKQCNSVEYCSGG